MSTPTLLLVYEEIAIIHVLVHDCYAPMLCTGTDKYLAKFVE